MPDQPGWNREHHAPRRVLAAAVARPYGYVVPGFDRDDHLAKRDVESLREPERESLCPAFESMLAPAARKVRGPRSEPSSCPHGRQIGEERDVGCIRREHEVGVKSDPLSRDLRLHTLVEVRREGYPVEERCIWRGGRLANRHRLHQALDSLDRPLLGERGRDLDDHSAGLVDHRGANARVFVGRDAELAGKRCESRLPGGQPLAAEIDHGTGEVPVVEPATDALTCFEHTDAGTPGPQTPCADEARQPRTDHDRIVHSRASIQRGARQSATIAS